MIPSTATLVDLAERTLATFAQGFLAVLVVNQGSLTQLTALETGAVAGGFAVAKFLLVKANGFLNQPTATTTTKTTPTTTTKTTTTPATK